MDNGSNPARLAGAILAGDGQREHAGGNVSQQVKVELPSDLAAILDPSGEALDAKVREALVLYLFEHDEISSGAGAQLLGMARVEFWDLLYQRGIPYFRQTPEELMEDLRVAEAIRKSPGS